MHNDLPIREPDDLRRGCADKLRKIETSGLFTSILACLLNEDWTDPALAEMYLAPGGCLFGRVAGDSDYKATALGAEADLLRNIRGIANVADLDGDELGYLLGTVARLKRIE